MIGPTHLTGVILLMAGGGIPNPKLDLSYGPDPVQKFDFYEPAPFGGAGEASRPLVLFFHGSGGKKESVASIAINIAMLKLLLNNGIPVASVEHHALPSVYPSQVSDAVLATQHFKTHAEGFATDPDRIVIWGQSSGAMIAGCAVYGPDPSARPLAFMNWGGLSNFVMMAPNFSGWYFGVPILSQTSLSLLQEASFTWHVANTPREFTPPAASYFGTIDEGLPFSNPHDIGLMLDFHDKLQAFPAAAASSLMLQNENHPDVHWPKTETLAVWVKKRTELNLALNLGEGLSATGAVPELSATGNYSPGGILKLTLESKTGKGTPFFLVHGLMRKDIPFAGGSIIPEPTSIVLLQTDDKGAWQRNFAIPIQGIGGDRLYIQAWFVDPNAPLGFASSNAVMIPVEGQ